MVRGSYEVSVKSKLCTKCSIDKNYTEFYQNKYSKSGLSSHCKSCLRNRDQSPEWKKKNKEKSSKWYAENKEEYRKRQNKYYREVYYKENKEKLVKKSILLNKKRYHSDVGFRISHHVSSRIRLSVFGNEKGRIFDLLGYSKNEFIAHFEARFNKGMSWDNYGDWQIDHIKPISKFTIKSYQCLDFKKCWSLSNLQPLWAEDNRKKGSKYEE